MIYNFVCPEGHEDSANIPKEHRNDTFICQICNKKMTRVFGAPFNSKIIGLDNAMKRDGAGYLIDHGRICEPVTRK